jgi:hypothetical protein
VKGSLLQNGSVSANGSTLMHVPAVAAGVVVVVMGAEMLVVTESVADNSTSPLDTTLSQPLMLLLPV